MNRKIEAAYLHNPVDTFPGLAAKSTLNTKNIPGLRMELEADTGLVRIELEGRVGLFPITNFKYIMMEPVNAQVREAGAKQPASK